MEGGIALAPAGAATAGTTPPPASHSLPALDTLGLAYNGISARGMKDLAKVLPRATPALTTLMFEGNQLGCKGVAALVALALLGDGKYGLKEDGEEEEGEIHGIGGGGGGGEEGQHGAGKDQEGGGKRGDGKEGTNAALKMRAPPPVLLPLKKLTLGSNGVGGEGAYAIADYINVLIAWAMYTDLNGGGGGGKGKASLQRLTCLPI